jgi:hypothetical protein
LHFKTQGEYPQAHVTKADLPPEALLQLGLYLGVILVHVKGGDKYEHGGDYNDNDNANDQKGFTHESTCLFSPLDVQWQLSVGALGPAEWW